MGIEQYGFLNYTCLLIQNNRNRNRLTNHMCEHSITDFDVLQFDNRAYKYELITVGTKCGSVFVFIV